MDERESAVVAQLTITEVQEIFHEGIRFDLFEEFIAKFQRVLPSRKIRQ